MRLIDADAFDKCLEDAEKEAIFMKKHVFASALNTIRGNLRIFPTIKPEPKWIPVDLRNNSPEENEAVLLGVRFRDDFKYFVTSRQDYNYWVGLGREIKGELKWQPLPEPYREEGEQDA